MKMSPDDNKITTSDDLMSFLQRFKKSMEKRMVETKGSMNDMENKIEATNRKIYLRLDTIDDEVKKVNAKIDANDDINRRMEARLSALEVEMKKSSNIRRRNDELRAQEKMLVDQPLGRIGPANQS